LLQVIPQAVLELLTCQELEERVCGSAEITIEALKKNGMHAYFIVGVLFVKEH